MPALLFDFNGTLSEDEHVQLEVYRHLFEAVGKPLSGEEYVEQLAGLSDPEIVERWLGPHHPAASQVLEDRVRLVHDRVGDGSTVPDHVREAVLRSVGRARLGVVSGAARSEVETVLRAAGIDVFDVVVAFEDVVRGKPAPDGYLLALERLDVRAAQAVAIEDTSVGVAAAKAAGLYCVAVLGTLEQDRLTEADEVVPRLDAELTERLIELVT